MGVVQSWEGPIGSCSVTEVRTHVSYMVRSCSTKVHLGETSAAFFALLCEPSALRMFKDQLLRRWHSYEGALLETAVVRKLHVISWLLLGL